MNILKDLKQKYKTGNIVVKIIFIAVIFTFSLNVISYLFFKENTAFLYSFLSLPSSWLSFITFPLSIFTYAFIPEGLFALAFNLLGLYYVGNLFLSHFREQNFLTFFFLGIVGGGLIFLTLSLFFDSNGLLNGLLPTIFCLLFAIIAYQPKINIQLLFVNVPIQLQSFGYIILGLQLLIWLSKTSDLNPLVHIGSAGLGYIYMKQFELGNDFIGTFINKIQFKKKDSIAAFSQKPPRDDYEYQDLKAEKQKRLDEILGKISAKGYETLTKEEKEFLFKASKD